MTCACYVAINLLLLLTGAAKLYSTTGTDAILGYTDPVLGINYRMIFLVAGGAEIATVYLMLGLPRHSICFLLPGWLGVCFITYRVLWWLERPAGYCPCMGTLTTAIHLSPSSASVLFFFLALVLLAGSALMAYSRRSQRANPTR